MSKRFGVLTLFAVLALPAVAGAADPTFTTVKLPGSGSRQEPRIAVAGDDTRYAVALDTTDSVSQVWQSKDAGLTFQKTAGDPPQSLATIDVDVVTLPSGRIISSELDEGGLNFPTGYSDDGGKTWTQSVGANTLADQDRQWFAVGPVPKGSPAGTQAPVYLLYHNFATGVAQHNMWVATSTDGGATFGPPVPTAQPGSDAYLDLQCSDSGGPSNITVNPKTGVIYAFFTTRAAPTPTGQDAGGCGASVLGPLEFNIVNGTRVWVATSKTGAPGTWSDSLAVDDAATQQVVSMQLAYGALDNAGNVYVAYPESPNAYPDLEGAAIKLTWQTPDSNGNLPGKWSKPTTLVAPTPHAASSIVGGSNLVHLIAGDPGRIAVAYYYGEPVTGPLASTTTPYFPYILQSFDALSQDPHVSRYKISDFPAYKWSTSGMMGLCARALSTPVAGGVYAGLGCTRSTDVWGIAADAQCRVMSAWAESDGTGTGGTGAKAGSAESGTFVTTQTGGPTLCAKTSSVPGGSPGIPFQPTPAQTIPGCPDQVAPNSHVTGKQVSRKQIFLSGNAIDHGCGVTGAKARARVRAVAVGVGHVIAAHKCRYLKGDGTFGPVVLCKDPSYVVASGAAKWALTLKGTFPKGQYQVWTRATDVVNNVQRKPHTRHLVHFPIR